MTAPTAPPVPATRRAAGRCPPALLRQARRQFDDSGLAPAELLGEPLARSWQRCRGAGLPSHGRASGVPHASAAQLARGMERQCELLSHARPVLDDLLPLVQATGSLLILADARGMLLQTLGDDHFADRAQRVALRPGAQWSEPVRGTNAIGTALVEAAPVVVHGGEHYLERNGFLSCCAAPIVDPAGRLLGAIDISGDHRAFHPGTLAHTLGLASAASRMIEHRLFDTWHAAGLRLRLHAQPEGLGTLGEGLLALAEDGRVIGANSHGLAALGLPRSALGQADIAEVLGVTLAQLLASLRADGGAPQPLQRPGGQRLWLRLEAGRRVLHTLPVAAAAASPLAPTPPLAQPGPVHAVASDALAALDTGDAAMATMLARARRVLDKPIALLIQGESGTGKEVLARALHASSARRRGPFVAVNCAALPETLIESELFGYQGGAFTGARREGAPGRVREAQGGTLFLDEIGDMPPTMQARLLRVLQDRAVVPVGGGRPVAVDCALVCATHRDLRAAIADGRFREDLYYRLNGLTLPLPPLRARSDLPALLDRLLAQALPDRPVRLAPALAQAFAAYRWPGNLRQLANALRTAAALLGDGEAEIGWPHLPDDLADDLRAAQPQPHGTAAGMPTPAVPDDNLRLQQDHTVRRVLETCGGNLSETARRLGISRNTLYRRLRGAAGVA
jgi:transcriptional regulator of acetoin/glycerol metabolism